MATRRPTGPMKPKRKVTGPLQPGRSATGPVQGGRKVTRNRAGDELTVDAKGNKLTYKTASSGAVYDYTTKKYVQAAKSGPMRAGKPVMRKLPAKAWTDAAEMQSKPMPGKPRKPRPNVPTPRPRRRAK